MHASIWKFNGDPDELASRYEALIADFPTEAFIAHLCLTAPDGLVIFDTCPSREAFEAFSTGEEFRDARRRHGMPDPVEVRDYPVHAAVISSTMPISQQRPNAEGQPPIAAAADTTGRFSPMRSSPAGSRPLTDAVPAIRD